MKQHRDFCRKYASIYQTKLTSKKVSQEIEDCLTDCEKKLDIFNLVIIRQQIEMEVSIFVNIECIHICYNYMTILFLSFIL